MARRQQPEPGTSQSGQTYEAIHVQLLTAILVWFFYAVKALCTAERPDFEREADGRGSCAHHRRKTEAEMPRWPTERLAHDHKVLASGSAGLEAIEMTCLAILFSGGKVWGDKQTPGVAHLRSMRQGVNLERQRLLRVYKEEGTARLIEELNKPVLH